MAYLQGIVSADVFKVKAEEFEVNSQRWIHNDQPLTVQLVVIGTGEVRGGNLATCSGQCSSASAVHCKQVVIVKGTLDCKQVVIVMGTLDSTASRYSHY